MRSFQCLAILGGALLVASCAGNEAPFEPAGEGPNRAVADQTVKLTGSAHHTRTVGAVTALTTFTFNAKDRGNGSAMGSYHYDFRAANFTVDGTVTCLSVAGNQVWVGGVVDRITGEDPTLQDLVGADMWWRAIDNGEGSQALPDSTTGLGFKFPTTVITKESWCADQPLSLVMREVEKGNVQLR